MENKKVAIITFLSISSKKEEIVYEVDNVKNDDGTPWVESGINTNDAPVKYLLNKAQKDGNSMGSIVCIVSKEVYDGKDGDRENSTYSNFEKMIKEKYNVTFDRVMYDFEECNGKCQSLKIEQHEKASKICEGIISALKGYEEVYIDYTGGFRDTSFLTTVLIRYLEFINVKCKDIVYSNYHDKKIYSISYIYDIFKLINAVSQFVETGNGKLLKSVYNTEENQEIKEIIEVIYDFSQAMQLCNIATLDDKIEKLNEAVQTLEKTKIDSKNLKVIMFYELLDVIKKKFYINGENYEFTYPKLIKWCLDNDLLQQALTLYVEKMPKVYFGENIINRFEYKSKKTIPGSDKDAEMFYTGLYDDIKEKNGDVNVKAFQDIVTRIASDGNKCKIADIISKEEQQCNSVEIKKAIERVYKLLEKHYEGCNYEKKKHANNWELFDISINCTTGTKFLNDVAHKNNIAYSIVYDKKCEKLGTYANKISILKKIKEKEYKIDYLLNGRITADELQGIMTYYMAIKYMRNNINHASEANKADDKLLDDLKEKDKYSDKLSDNVEPKHIDSKILSDYLKEKHINIEITSKNLHDVLSDGLDITHHELFE